MYEDCLRNERGDGYTAGCPNPDIHSLIHGFFGAAGQPSIPL
jgi:hypothetical protein